MDDEFYFLIEKLKDSKKIIIVEGLKDKRALTIFGLKNIITLKKPLYAVVEEAASKGKDAAILTDLDRQGKLLYSKLNSGLQSNGVRVDNQLRNFLFRKTKIRQIEGLRNYV